MGHRVGRLDGRNDALHAAGVLKGVHRLVIGDGHILRPANVVEPGVLRPDARIVQPGGNRIYRGDLPILVLAEIALHPVEDAQASGGNSRRRLRRVHAAPRRLAADQPHRGVVNEVIEGPDGVGTAAHAGQHRVGQSALPLQHLGLDLLRDHRLKVPHDGGEGVGTHDGAQAVVGVRHPAGPLPHGLAHRVLQGGRAGGHGDDLGPQQPHFIHVQRLAAGVLLPHEHHALHAHQGGGGGGGHAVLARSRLGNEPGLAHLLGQQGLAQHVVDLVGPGVVQVLPLEVNFGPAQVLGHPLGKVQPGGPPGVVVQQSGQLGLKLRVLLIVVISLLQLDHRVHQRLGHILPAVNAKSSF